MEGGNPWDIGGGCTMDYMPVPCSFARERAEAGTAAVPYLIHTTKGFRYEVGAIESYGAGVFRRWIPGRKIEVEHDDPSDDVVRVWTDETRGEWAFLSFAFQNPQKAKTTPYVDEKVLNSCTDELFGVTLKEKGFIPTTLGSAGSLTGTGPDVINNSGNNSTFTVTNNASKYSLSDLKKIHENLTGTKLSKNERVTGLARSDYPWLNYTANNLTPQLEVLKLKSMNSVILWMS